MLLCIMTVYCIHFFVLCVCVCYSVISLYLIKFLGIINIEALVVISFTLPPVRLCVCVCICDVCIRTDLYLQIMCFATE